MGSGLVGEAEIRAAAADWLSDWLWWRGLGPRDEVRAMALARLHDRESDRVEFRFRWTGSLAHADGSRGDREAVFFVRVRPDCVVIAVPDRDGGHELHCAWQAPTAPGRPEPPGGAGRRGDVPNSTDSLD